jgi:hypothetical protein
MQTQTKALLAGTSLLVALLAFAGPAAAWSIQTTGPTTCGVEDLACFCVSVQGTCTSSQGNKCVATVGPNDTTQIGVVCT